jgi:MFS family permease
VTGRSTAHVLDVLGRRTGIRWWLFAPSPLAAAALGLVSAVSPALRADVKIGYAGLAALFVAQTIGTVTGAAIVGLSRSRLMRPIPMCLLAATALCLCVTQRHLGVLLVLFACSGFAVFALNARAQSEISLIAGAGRTRMLSVFHVLGGGGGVAFPILIAVLLWAGVSWRAIFVVLAVVFVLYAFACRAWKPTDHPEGVRIGAILELVHGRARAALIVAVLGLGLQAAVPLWIPAIMHDRFGASPASASAVVGLYMLSLLATRIAATFAIPRVAERSVLIVAAASVVVGHVVLFFAPNPAAMLVATVLLGGGAGPLLPVAIARVVHSSGHDRLGTAAVMSLAAAAQIVLPASVVLAKAAGLSLQHSASVTVFAAALVLVWSTRV